MPNAETTASTNTVTPTLTNSTNTMPAWRQLTRSQPPMTPGKFTPALGVLSAATLVLTGCSSDDENPEEAGEQNQVEILLATDARADQRAAGGATAMAMELGFDQVQTASETEIATVKKKALDRADTEHTMSPQSCAGPIAVLDWPARLADCDGIPRACFSTEHFHGAD